MRESFHKGHRVIEDQMLKRNEQMHRTAIFNKSGKFSRLCNRYPSTLSLVILERETRIEKDNLNLLQKLEDIKRKGTVSCLRILISNDSYSSVNNPKKADDKPTCFVPRSRQSKG